MLSYLLSKCRILFSDKPSHCAAVNPKSEIIVGHSFLELSMRERVSVILHEVLHVALQHFQRAKDIGANMKIFNMASDVIINYLLRAHNFDVPWGSISAFQVELALGMRESEIVKMSTEELYYLLTKIFAPKHGEGSKLVEEAGKRIFPDLDGTAEGSEVIQEGAREIYGSDEAPEKWRDAFVEAVVLEKATGLLPAGLGRIIEHLLKPKVDWKSLLRQHVRTALAKFFVQTWQKESRRLGNDFPGYKSFSVPKVYCLVDTSGSISEQELSQFMSEVYSVSRSAELRVICWDAKAYEMVKARSPSEVIAKVLPKIKGGGGTCIYPALERISKESLRDSIVVVFSDWDIADLYGWTLSKMEAIASRCMKSIAVTVRSEPKVPANWEKIRVSLCH